MPGNKLITQYSFPFLRNVKNCEQISDRQHIIKTAGVKFWLPDWSRSTQVGLVKFPQFM